MGNEKIINKLPIRQDIVDLYHSYMAACLNEPVAASICMLLDFLDTGKKGTLLVDTPEHVDMVFPVNVNIK